MTPAHFEKVRTTSRLRATRPELPHVPPHATTLSAFKNSLSTVCRIPPFR
jgi:hypothetical protein